MTERRLVVRVAAYVDGFNLYFGLKAKYQRKYLWLDLQALAVSLLRPGQTLERVTVVREHDYVLTPGRYVGARVATDKPADSILELRRELDRLHLRAVAADTAVDGHLNRIAAWIH